MYINYEYLYQIGLTDTDYHTLQIALQKEGTLLLGREESIRKLLGKDYLRYTKGKPVPENLRLSKKGSALMKQLNERGFREDISILCEELQELYTALGKPVGTLLETRSRMNWFVQETGFALPLVDKMVKDYVQDANRSYFMRLDNLIWKPQSVAFSVHKNLKDSKLYDMLCTRYNVPQTFHTQKNKNTVLTYLLNVCKLKLPARGEKEIFFTGNYKTDLQHWKNMRTLLAKQIKNHQ